MPPHSKLILPESTTSSARQRVVALNVLAEIIQTFRTAGKTVAHCHGCFDILHFGHVRHFEAAKRLADILVVTVTPDRFVNKGPNRPVFPENQRAEVVAGLSPVNWVAVNEWASAVKTIHLLRPDLFIKGEEYESRALQVNPLFIEEAQAVKEIGGKIAFTREETSSSTAAVKRMASPGT